MSALHPGGAVVAVDEREVDVAPSPGQLGEEGGQELVRVARVNVRRSPAARGSAARGRRSGPPRRTRRSAAARRPRRCRSRSRARVEPRSGLPRPPRAPPATSARSGLPRRPAPLPRSYFRPLLTPGTGARFGVWRFIGVMAPMNPQSRRTGGVWALVRAQHGQVEHGQLLALGYSQEAIRHRIARGRLHPTRPRVYSVGRPIETRVGEWMAAVLSCGAGGALSHVTAAAHWAIREETGRTIHVTVPPNRDIRQPSLAAHRRSTLEPTEVTVHDGIPVTTPARTLIDLAVELTPRDLEAAVNQADKLDLIDPEALRRRINERSGLPGVARLRRVLDRSTFSLTDSELERRFVPLAMRAGLPKPLTQQWLQGFRVDFYWPGLGLVVETDGLRYHRTAAQQARDRLRDQTLTGRRARRPALHARAGALRGTPRGYHASPSGPASHVWGSIGPMAPMNPQTALWARARPAAAPGRA